MPAADANPQKAIWRSIVSTAIETAMREHPNTAISGARLRAFIVQAALTQGVSFPPADEPDLKLSQLLLRYPDVCVVARRQGQDMLVAPADRPELLTEPVTAPLQSVRQDLFEAFTRITPTRRAFYSPLEDKVVYYPVDAPMREGIEAIPATSLELELVIRREFLSSLEPAQREPLSKALLGENPLGEFGVAVRKERLQRAWHVYRTRQVIWRIDQWASKIGVPFRDSWVTSGAAALSPRVARTAAGSSGEHFELTLARLLEGLSSEDLSRITVPLDVVLKALAPRQSR